MNNRDYKDFAPNEVFHIYNRGVDKMNIFKNREDFVVFLFRLKENLFPELTKKPNSSKSSYRRKTLPPNSFDLISYCLMPNHFHLLIKQNGDISVTQLMLKVCTGYSKYFNKKYNRVGAVFQDKFKSVRVKKNEQLLWTSFYIHKNPQKSELISDLSDYEWSSYPDYCGLRNGILCKKDLILGQFDSLESYLRCFKDLEISKEIENKTIGHQDLLIDNELQWSPL